MSYRNGCAGIDVPAYEDLPRLYEANRQLFHLSQTRAKPAIEALYRAARTVGESLDAEPHDMGSCTCQGCNDAWAADPEDWAEMWGDY